MENLNMNDVYEDYLKSLKANVSKAVAISYNKESDNAPVITAKGERYLASNIISLAKKHGIPIIYDEKSVGALMKINVGSEIPVFMYKALSIILANIYRLSGKS